MRPVPGWRPGARRVAGVAAIGTLLSCSTVLTDIQVAPIVGVRVAPDSMDLPIGSDSTLHAFPLDSTGAFRPIGISGWTTSDGLIATVSESGVVAGIAAGTVTVTATARSIQGTARVRVGPAPLITLAADSLRFDAAIGQPDPPPQVIAVTNGGGLALGGLAIGTVDYGNGPPAWLVAQFDTTIAPAALTVQVVTSSLTQPGTWLAIVPITAPIAGNSPRSLRVALVLVAP